MVDDSFTSNLQKQAIEAALNCNWEVALDINKKIIKLDSENVDCLNRLAKAYIELGKFPQAKKICEEALKLDPYNTISQKNLNKIIHYKKNGQTSSNGLSQGNSLTISPELFLEEPGTTKLVNLTKVAEPQKLLTLSSGQIVNLIAKNKGIFVTDQNNQYLGVLPDDTGFHLRKLMTGGNKYVAIIKSVKNNGLTILIREVYRSKKFKNQASFIDAAKVLSYSSDNISTLMGSDMEEIIEEQSEVEEATI